MRLINQCRAADAWLLETKFQPISEWLHNCCAISTIRSGQICFAIACGLLVKAFAESIDSDQLLFAMAALCGALVILLEPAEFIRRKMEARLVCVDLRDLITANMRIAYDFALAFVTIVALLLKLSDAPESRSPHLAFAVVGVVWMILGLYFISCKGKPRKPRVATPKLQPVATE